MAIQKQEFYEGAALHVLARTGRMLSVAYQPPFYILNGCRSIYLKYCTRGRSPWSFTFNPSEQLLMQARSSSSDIVIGLICGSDGIASLSYGEYLKIAPHRATAVHIACYRQHGEFYEVNGPGGTLDWKVAPSKWKQLLDD